MKLNLHKFSEEKSFDDFFISSNAFFKVCKKPKRKPDYISYKKNYGSKSTKIYNSQTRYFVNYKQEIYSFESLVERLKSDFNIVKIELIHACSHLCGGAVTEYRIEFNYWIKLDSISSLYCYCSNSKGDYVIRESDHWGRVASCNWKRSKDFNGAKVVCAKSYINLAQ